MSPLTCMAALLLVLLLSPPARAGGVDSTKISLPKGPASIEGLGRNFEPSLASGTASYGIDIAVPPAVAGFGPKLSLDYDSGGGVSELGMGWRLNGVPSIRRRVDEGLPRFDETDAFEVAGIGLPSDLLEVAPGVFRPEHESGAFLRVTRGRDGSTWEARVKNGFTYRFGGEGFVEAEDGRVATYLLREQHDLHGHVIRYDWETTDGHALLTSVTWNDFSEKTRIRVAFEYEERPDVVERFSSGIRQVLARRLKTIDVNYGGDLVRRYTLGYGEGSHSRLAEVTLVGTDGVTAMPTLSFQYTEPSFAADGQLTTMRSAPGRSPEEADVELADLNGDSLPDLFVTEPGAYRSYINHDGVSWRPAEAWSASNSPSLALSSTGVQLADVDGDGAVDLLAKSGTTSFRFFPGLEATRFAPPVSIATVPNFTFEDPDVRLADMDGDRRADVIITTEAGLAIGYNLRGTDWALPEIIGEVDRTQPLRFSDGHTQLCDVNGDRVQDLCYLRSESLVYWLGRGRGAFEPARRGSGVPTWDASSPWQLHDLDGDGWVDLVHIGVNQVSYALATAAGQFGEVRRVAGAPEQGPDVSVTFADMNGSGTTDIVWIDPRATANTAWRYLELFPKGRAGLLRRIDNGLGKISRIHYEPAAQNAARARDVGEPWTTRMNVGMPVVSRVEIDASLGDPLLAVEYNYHDGTWDPKERTFAGFGRGLQTELGDEYTPTLLTESTFDTGFLHRVLRGEVLTTEQRDALGTIFSRATSTYTPRVLATALDGRTVHYAYKSAERVEHIEGTDLSQARTTLTEWVQDQYGNVTRESRWGEVVGDDKLAGDDEAVAVRTYANNTDDWLLGYLANEELQDGDGNRVALKRHYYDGEAFEGLPLGEVHRGDLRRTEAWIEDSRFVDDERFDHDLHGNVVAALNPVGGRLEFDYDPSKTFVVAERQFAKPGDALEWTADYDVRFGAVTHVQGPNGELYDVAYDPLGRVTKIAHPGDSLALPTTAYEYELRAPVSLVREHTREQAGQSGVVTELSYFDGLTRPRANLREGSEPGQWVIEALVSYGARGNPVFAARASFATSSELPSVSQREGIYTYYDALGRNVGIVHPDSARTKIAYFPLGRSSWDENDTDPDSPHYDTPTTHEADGLGRLRRIVERVGDDELTTGIYEYNPLGQLTRLQDAAGSVRTYGYDGRSRRTWLRDPNAGEWRFAYTPDNELERRTDPTGRVVRYEHDSLGRVLKEFHMLPGEAERLVSSYTYDAPSSDHPELAHLRGRLVSVRDAAGEIFYGYDPRGNATEGIRRFPDGAERITWTDFDSGNRPTRRGFPDGTFYETRYDARGTIASIGPFVTAAEWNADGELTSAVLGNAVTEEREYDARERLEVLRAVTKSGSTVRALQLGYDRASLVRSFTDLAPNPTAKLELTARFDYDDRYRLTTLTDAAGTTRYEHDPMSNLLSVASPHPHLRAENSFSEDGAPPDQLTGRGDQKFRYDAAGRMTSDGEREFSWDAKGRLARVQRGSLVEEYVYDHKDRRTLKTTAQGGQTSTVRYLAGDAEERDGQLVRYVSLDDERLARLDAVRIPLTPAAATAPPLARLFGGRISFLTALLSVAVLALLVAFARWSRGAWRTPRTLAALVPLALLLSCADGPSDNGGLRADARRIDTLPAGTVFYSADHQETPLALTNAQGEVVSQTRAFPYGVPRSSEGEAHDPFGFVGNELDGAMGLADFHARPYDARLGIFLAPDPIAVFEPDNVIKQPLGLSAYAYAHGNPVTFSDPSGLCLQYCGDAQLANEQRMLNHADPEVRAAAQAYMEKKETIASVIVPMPAAPAAGWLGRLAVRMAPKAARVVVAGGRALASKAAQAARGAGTAVKKTAERVATALRGTPNAGGSIAAKALPAPKMVRHHIFNKFRGNSPGSQKYRDFFKKHGINVDDYAVQIPESLHKAIHGAGKNWTTRWKKWIDANPNANTKEVYQQAGRMMDEYGISGRDLIPYR